MIQQLCLFSVKQCPELQQVIIDIKSKLTDIYFDSKILFEAYSIIILEISFFSEKVVISEKGITI